MAEVLEKKLSAGHAQSEHPSQVAMEAVQQEKEQLKVQLEKQVQENIQLVKYVCYTPKFKQN